MVSQAKESHTPNRVVRVPDEDWEDFGKQVGERHRAQLIRDFIAWHLHRPGAKMPKRPQLVHDTDELPTRPPRKDKP